MNVTVAISMPIVANCSMDSIEFNNLSLLFLPRKVTILVYGKWDELITNCEAITSDYELFSLLLELPVTEVSFSKKAPYIKLDPDILEPCDTEEKEISKQQLYALSLYEDSRRIFAGTSSPAKSFEIIYDKNSIRAIHLNPYKEENLLQLIDSFEPRLVQLKHFHEARKDGNRDVSAFTAYDKNDERYAKRLLRQAYDEHLGDITDETYLYTYDAKNKTFVEFRPNRGNEYHGQDISLEVARRKAPEIVRMYHK